MREFPQGGIIGKTVHLWRRISRLRVSLYAANASFFLILAAFPALLLLLGLLRYTPLEVERLGEMLTGFLPGALAEGAEELILLTYDNTSGLTLGLSVVTTLWSAGRGIYGMITGLNAVYEAEENRGYFHVRFLSVVYTFLFLLVLILTLTFHVFGIRLLLLLKKHSHRGTFCPLEQCLWQRVCGGSQYAVALFLYGYCVLRGRSEPAADGITGKFFFVYGLFTVA